MTDSPPNRNLTTFTRVVLLIALYFLGGLLGKETSFLSGTIALVWPPAGIALAAILLFGYRFWPGVALGAVLFSFMNGTPIGFFTLGTAIGNTMGAVVCVFLLKRFVAFENSMERIWDVIGYVGLACFLGTTVNALFCVVSLAYAGSVTWDNLLAATLVWWVPNALAGLVVAPFIIAWATPPTLNFQFNSRALVEAVVCGTGLVFGTLVSFDSWFVYGIQSYPLAYLPFPFLFWGALRFGQRGATTGTLLVSALAIYSLLHRRGPFVADREVNSLMLIGSYIGTLAITNLLLAAASAARRKAELARAQSESQARTLFRPYPDLRMVQEYPHGQGLLAKRGAIREHAHQRDPHPWHLPKLRRKNWRHLGPARPCRAAYSDGRLGIGTARYSRTGELLAPGSIKSIVPLMTWFVQRGVQLMRSVE